MGSLGWRYVTELRGDFRLPRQGAAAIIRVRTENAQELDETPTLRDQRLVRGLPGGFGQFLCGRPAKGSWAALPHLEDGTSYRTKQLYRVPCHNSKTVVSIVKIGPLVEGEVNRDQERAPHSSLKPVVLIC